MAAWITSTTAQVLQHYVNNDIEGTLQVFSSASAPTSVPEPGSLALLGLGLVGFAVKGYGRRRVQV